MCICFQVFGAVCKLELGLEVWERILYLAFELLTHSRDENLVAAMSFILKAASQCQRLSEAVCILFLLELY